MADINIRRKGPGPLWWMLGLLAIAGVVWWVVAVAHRRRQVIVTGPSATPAGEAGGAGAGAAPESTPLGSLASVVLVPDRLALLGREVDLHQVPVQQVVGEGEFWVGPGRDERLFVVRTGLAPAGRPAGPRPGELVDVHGVVERVPEPLDAPGAPWSVPPGDTATLRSERIYVAADSIGRRP